MQPASLATGSATVLMNGRWLRGWRGQGNAASSVSASCQAVDVKLRRASSAFQRSSTSGPDALFNATIQTTTAIRGTTMRRIPSRQGRRNLRHLFRIEAPRSRFLATYAAAFIAVIASAIAAVPAGILLVKYIALGQNY